MKIQIEAPKDNLKCKLFDINEVWISKCSQMKQNSLEYTYLRFYLLVTRTKKNYT